MILKQIRLNNIRSYTSGEIKLPEGSVLLSGDIGTGKSTVLIAAEFALFGIMKGDLSGENLLRHGAKEGFVELKFEVDGKEVMIKRNLKRGKDSVKQESGYTIIDGKKVEGTHVELKTRILDLLGYPKELVSKSKSLVYRYTVYTPQEEMKSILFGDSEERLDILRRVFGIDRYKRIAENSQILARSMREKSKELEGKIYGLEDKNRQLSQSKKELEKTKDSIAVLKSRLDSQKRVVDDKNKSVEETEKSVQALKELKKEIELNNIRLNEKASLREKNIKEEDALAKEIDGLKKRISAINVEGKLLLMKEIEERIEEKDIKIKERIGEKSGLSERLKHLEARLKQLRKSAEQAAEQSKGIAEKEKELEELRKKVAEKESTKKRIKEIEEEITKLSKRMAEMEAIKKSSESVIKKITELDNCPTCLRPVDKDHKKRISGTEDGKIKQSAAFIKQAEEELNEKSDILEKLHKNIDTILEHEKTIEKLTAEIRLSGRARESLAESQKEVTKAEAELEQTTKRLEYTKKDDVSLLAKQLEEDKIMLKKIQEKMHLQDMLDEKLKRKDEIAGMQEDIKKDIGLINKNKIGINEGIKKLGDAEERYIKAKKELENARENQKKIEIEEKGLSTQAESVAGIIGQLEKEVEEKLFAKAKLEKISQMQSWIDNSFLNIVGIIEKNVMHRIHSQFRDLFQQWFRALVEDEAISISLDESFTPIVAQDGYEATLDGLSGGEKTAVALAYRLSLNKVVNDMIETIKTKDIIILDEPTDGFSSEQLDRVREVIDELNMKQVVIVSHEPKVESFVDNVIRIEKSGHISSICG